MRTGVEITKWQKLGPLIITSGIILNVAGAALNSIHLRLAFPVWIVSNSLCAFFFLMAWRGTWRVDAPTDQKMIGMYCFFLITAIIGWGIP